MLLPASFLILLLAGIFLIVLHITQQNIRYAFWAAVSGALLSMIAVAVFQMQMPLELRVTTWQAGTLFEVPILFFSDQNTWVLAFSISILTLANILTSVARLDNPNPLNWAGTLALGAMGIMAVTAGNIITLLLVWAALDLTELFFQVTSADRPENNDRIVTSFFVKTLGISLLLWAQVSDFSQSPAIFLILAAGLRLGVLPLHLSYSAEAATRRELGTSLRLISAASSLVVLTKFPLGNLDPRLQVLLFGMLLLASFYGTWNWLRAPDELNGRPYWIISISALSMLAVLNGNVIGAIALNCVLVLVGGVLFLSNMNQIWLNRAMIVINFWGISALPFSLTASAYQPTFSWLSPLILVSMSLMSAGAARQALRAYSKENLSSQPIWLRTVYPIGIGIILLTQIILGIFGWDGALRVGGWVYSLLSTALALAFIWATPRLRILNPMRVHWISSTSSQIGKIYGNFWGLYRTLRSVSYSINSMLEGEGGILWTLLFLVIFITLLSQGSL